MFRFKVVLVILTISLSGFGRDVSGQTLPATPAADLCTAEPIAVSELYALPDAPDRILDTPEPSEDDVEPDTIAQIEQVIGQVIACTNANQPLSALALFTNGYLVEHFAGPGGEDELGHLIAASSRLPGPAAPEDRLAVLAITNPIGYGDGSVSVQVTTANAEMTYSDILILVQTGDGWRIDRVLIGDEVEPAGSPESGT
jgi:hypothetical protein